MLTEVELVKEINERLNKNELNEDSMKYVNKIKELENKLRELQQTAEVETQRIRGATALLVELVAESEGLLDKSESSQ